MKLKTRNENLEREAGKYARMVEDKKIGHRSGNENTMNIKLRKQYKDLQKDYDTKKEELERLKKEYRVSKIQELSQELLIYQESTKKQKIQIE